MRASVASLSSKLLSVLFVVTLALALVPSVSFAEEGPLDGLSAGTGADAVDIVNEEVALDAVVAQVERTKSFLLAQTLESTKTTPVVSAKLPIDGTLSADGDGTAPSDGVGISPDSTVIGSFTVDGLTYAIEPGGESVAVVAADYGKLPSEQASENILAIPPVVSADGADAYSVTRIADGAFSGLTEQAAGASAGIEGTSDSSDGRARGLDPSVEGEGAEDAEELESSEGQESFTGIVALGIPASISSIEDGAFSGSDTLQYLVVSDDNPTYASFDGALYSADLATLRLIPEGRVGAVRIAPSATDVDPEVFSHCPSVDTLVADADSAAYKTLSEDGKSYENAEGEEIRLLSPVDVDDQVVEPRISELLKYMDAADPSNMDIAATAHDLSERGFRAAEAPSSSQAIKNLPKSFVVLDGADFTKDTRFFSSFSKPIHLVVYCGRDTRYDIANSNWSGPPVLGGNATQKFDRKYGYYTGFTWPNVMFSFSPKSGFYVKNTDWYSGVGIGTRVVDTRKWKVAYSTTAATVENLGRVDGAVLYFPPPYTVEVEYVGTYTDHANGDAKVSGSWVSEKENVGSTVSKEVYDTGVDEPAGEDTLDIASPDSEHRYMPIPQNITSGYTFLGWNIDSAATAETETGWFYRTGKEADMRFITESTTLYAIYQKGYPVTWDIERFGGKLPCFEEFGANSEGAIGANTHTATTSADAHANDTEVAIIEDPTDPSLPASSRFPRVGNGNDTVRFLGWTDDASGAPPSWRTGPHAGEYFSWEDGTILLDKDSFKIVDGAGTVLESYDNAKFTNAVFYGVWETDVTFDASSYGGLIKGASSDGADAPSITISTFNNRPIPLASADDAAYEDMSDPANAHIPYVSAEADPQDHALVPNVYAAQGYDGTSWQFKGWTDQANPNAPDGGDVLDSSALGCKMGAPDDTDATDALRPDGATTYYGVWECEVSFEADASIEDGGSRPAGADIVPKAGGLYLYGYDLETTTVQGTPESHHFEAWRDTAGNEAVLSDGTTGASTYTVRTGGPLRAYWAPNARALVLNPNDADDAPITEDTPSTYAVYGEQMSLFEANEAGDGPSDVALSVPTREGYAFAGYWNTRFAEREGVSELVPTSDGGEKEVVAKRYYDTDDAGNLMSAAAFDITDDAQQLFAHWRYEIRFDANAGAHTASVMHKGSLMPIGPQGAPYQVDEWNNRYFYQDLEGEDADPANDMLIVSIEALWGVPVKLPYACSRTTEAGESAGYDDTRWWSASPVVDEAHPRIAVDEEGFTLGAEGSAQMAPPALSPTGSGPVTLYAIWEGTEHAYEVTLSAGEHAVDEEGSPWRDEVLKDILYGRTLRASGVDEVSVPVRDGHTFCGFYTEEEGGEAYIDANGAPVIGKVWQQTAEADADGVRRITLYARYAQDEYRVVYDLSLPDAGKGALADMTPGAQRVEGVPPETSGAWACGDLPSHEGGALPVAQTSPIATGSGLFFRNGYDFQGWYWVDDRTEDGVATAVMASSADGSPKDRFSPSLAWQKAHKGDGTLTLHAAWAPKTYALRFSLGYREQPDRILPDESMEGMVHPNKVAMRGGVYYYEVAYEQELTPFFEGAGQDARPAVPTDEPYAFVSWKEEKGGWILFGDDGDAATPAVLSGPFCPSYPLSTRAVGEGGAPALITFCAQWKEPAPANLTLDAGDAARGRFVTESFSDLDPAIFDEAASSERALFFHDVGYERTFDLMSKTSPYRPEARPGYALAGFVLTNEQGELLASDGQSLLGHGPYDEEGELRGDLPLLSSLSKLRGDVHAMAVYSKNKMVVELDMGEVPFHEGYEGYELYSEREDGTYGSGWLIGGSPHQSTVYAYDVSDEPFSLPSDVIVPGYAFTGWERVTPASAAPIPDAFDPAQIAADPKLAHQVFRPRFEERSYEVAFCANRSDGAEEERRVIVDFQGRILDAGDMAGEPGCERGEVLPMASVPAPDTSGSDGSHGGEDGDHPRYHSYPFSVWRIGTPYASVADVQERLADAKVASAEWSAWLDRFAPAVPGSRQVQGRLPIYAIWQRAISAVLPLSVSVALDPYSASVEMADAPYSVYGTGLLEGEALEVAALRYESVVEDGAGNVVEGGNVLATEGEPIRLVLFANPKVPPVTTMPTIDEDGIVRGGFALRPEAALSIDLSAERAFFGAEELASHGFAPFASGQDALAMYYGLDLDGVALKDVRALSEKLPSVKGELAENGWTKKASPVARLSYTVRVAS